MSTECLPINTLSKQKRYTIFNIIRKLEQKASYANLKNIEVCQVACKLANKKISNRLELRRVKIQMVFLDNQQIKKCCELRDPGNIPFLEKFKIFSPLPRSWISEKMANLLWNKFIFCYFWTLKIVLTWAVHYNSTFLLWWITLHFFEVCTSDKINCFELN